MKLSNLTAKLTFLKNNAVRALAVATLAGAALAAAPAAQAQRFAVGVRIGGPVFIAPRPVYVAPPIYAPGPIYFHGYDRGDWRFRHDFDRHDFDRDHRDFDRGRR